MLMVRGWVGLEGVVVVVQDVWMVAVVVVDVVLQRMDYLVVVS